MTGDTLSCWHCGAGLTEVPMPLSRQSVCRACGHDLYVCRMCRNFDTKLLRGCREDQAEPPRDKDRANFCDWFEASADAYEGGSQDAGAAARAALEDLFKP